ncbi:MAG: MFS transporter [Proteobacteria bacterium]|jgi:MFS family permease|nr:MFS transporter [Pseudomonadota bacterium]
MKRLGILWLVVFISLAGFGITTIPFPIVAEQMGASDFWKTFGGAGVFSLFQFLFTPIWGRCSDAYGRKPILVLSLAGTVVAFAWLSIADSLVSLLMARAFGGIMSGNLAAAFAYAADVTETKDRAKGLGIVASAFGVGFAIGPPLGGFLGTLDGGVNLFWPGIASAGLAVVALVGTVLFLPESLSHELRRPFGAAPAVVATPTRGSAPWSILAAKPVLVGLVVSSLMVAIAAGALQSVYPFWGRDLFGFSLKDVGLHFMAFALLSAIGQAGLTGPLSRRFGERRLAIGALVGVTVGLVLFSVAGSPEIAWLAICVFGFANGLFLPAISSLMSFEAADDERGAVMGVFNASSSAGRIVGPALSGPIYFKFGPAAPFVLSAMLTVFGALLMARRKQRR